MTKNQTFLVVDTETGGLNCEKHSILSIAGVIWEPRSKVEPIFDLYIKEHFINVVPQALKVNKIDLNKVYAGDEPFDAVQKIRNSLDEYLGTDRKPIQLVGHNVSFDLGFIKRLYRHAGQDYRVDFRDRALDTCSILQFLMISGKVDGYRASADLLFKTAGVELKKEDRHTALGDAVATAESLEALINKF